MCGAYLLALPLHSSPSISPATPGDLASRARPAPRWLRGLPWAIVGLGLWLRLGDQLFLWFSSDEGVHYTIVTERTPANIWGSFVNNPHPFASLALLWVLVQVSVEPAWLRLIGLVPGVAMIGFVWRSARLSGDRASAAVAALTVCVSVAAIEQSQNLRGYMLQCAMVAAALGSLASWLRTRRGLWGFSLALTMAVSSELSGVFVAFALALLFVGLRLQRRLTTRELSACACALIPAAVVFGVEYIVHFEAYLEGSAFHVGAMDSWLKPLIPTGAMHAMVLAVKLFFYLFGEQLAVPVLFVFALGLGAGLWRRSPFAQLSLLVFVVAVAAALASKHPFGPSRHSLYLLPFVALMLGEFVLLFRGLRGLAAALLLSLVVSSVAGGAWAARSLGLQVQPMAGEPTVSSVEWASIEGHIDSVTATESLIVVDLAMFYLLNPHMDLHRDPSYTLTPAGRSSHFDGCDVWISDLWTFQLDPRRRGLRSHLHTFLSAMDAEHPRRAPGRLANLWLMTDQELAGPLSALDDRIVIESVVIDCYHATHIDWTYLDRVLDDPE